MSERGRKQVRHELFQQPIRPAMIALAQGGAGKYVDVGVVHISVTNLIIIVLMLVVFAAALVLPFPHHDRVDHDSDGGES